MNRKNIQFILFLFYLLAASVDAHAKEPSFAEISKAFVIHEGLRGNELAHWEKLIKRAPYLPTLYVGYDRQLKQSQTIKVSDTVSIAGGDVTVGPEQGDTNLNNDLGNVFRVRAVWQLDQVMFNRDLFALARERRDLSVTRQKLISELFKVYDQRAQALAAYQSAHHSPKAAAYYAKYLSLTSRLDEATNGQFSDRFWKEKQ
jgi:hypothetical protein